MRIFRDNDTLTDADRGAAAAMGNFDGVHLGHQAVLDEARRAAADIGAPLGVITFDPHPRELFAPDAPAFRLMQVEAKARRLAQLGVERLYVLGFDRALAGLTAEEFVADRLAGRLGLRHVTVGADFRFGKGRAGDAAALQELGARHGIQVTAIGLAGAGAQEYSSTAIREALKDGRPADAAKMLGHWHRIEGVVEKGDQRGRTLGYPTINLGLAGVLPPKFGIYAVLVDILDGPHAGRYHGVASCGMRPTFDKTEPNFEAFLFDFNGDLYGAHASCALVEWQRPEIKFDDIDALVTQMDADSIEARRVLAAIS